MIPESTRGRIPRIIAAGTVGIIFLSGLIGSFYTVEQGDRAVLTRFGRTVAVEEPGLHFKMPFIETVTTLSVREQRISYKLSAYSKDQQPAVAIVSVNFQLLPSEVGEVYTRYGVDFISRLIAPQLPKRTEEVFGSFSAESIVRERVRLGAELEKSVRTAVDDRGVQIISVQVENIDFSDNYEQSIEQRMQAQVASVKAEADKTRRMTEADAASYEVKAAADAEAHAVRVRGEAAATAIKARAEALKGNSDLVSLTAVEKWDGKLPVTMLPQASLPFVGVR